MLRCDAVRGGGVEREQWRPLHSPLDFNLSLRYPQSHWAPLVLVPDGWACACSRHLWVSPTTSPVRLGVSPAAAPIPTGVFSQGFEDLFPLRWSPGLRGLLHSLPLVLVYLCANVGPRGLLLGLPAPFVPHSASLGPATATRVLSTLVPVSAPPTGLDECLFFISLLLDPLAV